MVRRLSAFVLALLIGVGPVASALCQAACQPSLGGDAPGAMAGHAGHHAHAPADTTVPAFTGVPRPCDHPSGNLIAIRQIFPNLIAPVLVAHLSFVPPRDSVFAARVYPFEHSPPGSVALIAQLRV